VDMGSESSDSDSEAWVAYRAPGQTCSPRERTRRVSLPLAPSRDVGLLLAPLPLALLSPPTLAALLTRCLCPAGAPPRRRPAEAGGE